MAQQPLLIDWMDDNKYHQYPFHYKKPDIGHLVYIHNKIVNNMLPEAPKDGNTYGRENGNWVISGGSGFQFKGDNYTTVLEDKGSEVANGEELLTKFNDIKTWTPQGNPLATDNIVTLLAMGGVYDLGSNYLHFDTDFVHIKSLDGKPIHLKTTHTEVFSSFDIRCPVVVDDGVDAVIGDLYCDEEYTIDSPPPGITNPVKSTFKVGDCPNLVVNRCFGGLFSFSNTTGNLTSEFNNNTSTGNNCFYGITNSSNYNNNTSNGDNCFYGLQINSATYNNNTSTGDNCFSVGTHGSISAKFYKNIGNGVKNFGYSKNITQLGEQEQIVKIEPTAIFIGNISGMQSFGGVGSDNSYMKGRMVGNTASYDGVPLNISFGITPTAGGVSRENVMGSRVINNNFIQSKPIALSANTVTYYAPEDMSIDNVTDPSSIGTTINVNGVAYTLGDPIQALDKIEISSTGTGVVNVVQIYTKHIS